MSMFSGNISWPCGWSGAKGLAVYRMLQFQKRRTVPMIKVNGSEPGILGRLRPTYFTTYSKNNTVCTRDLV